MRPLESIVILVEPGTSADPKDKHGPTQREFDEYDRFAAELQRHMSARVELMECRLADAPSHCLLLVAYHLGMRDALETGHSHAGNNEPKPILLNVDYKEAFALAETALPAGIVSSERFIRWLLRQEDRIFRQVYGLKSLSAQLAPMMRSTAMGETEHYCVYRSDEVLTLAHMLSVYIAAYWRSL